MVAFSATGKELWRTNLGGRYSDSEPLLADLDGDGKLDVLGWVTTQEIDHATNAQSLGKIVRLDKLGHVAGRYEPGVCIVSCLAADVDGDGLDEILSLTDHVEVLKLK